MHSRLSWACCIVARKVADAGKGVAGHEPRRSLLRHRVWACGGCRRPGKPQSGQHRYVCQRRWKRCCSCSRAAAVAERGKTKARDEGQERHLDSEYQLPGPASAEPAHEDSSSSTSAANTARRVQGGGFRHQSCARDTTRKRHHAHLISATSSVDLREWTPLQSIRLKSVIACDASIPCFLRWLAVQSHPLPLVAFFPAVLGCEGSATARKAPTSSPIRDCAVACKSRQRRYSDSAPLAH